MIPEIVKSIAGSVVRWALTGLAAFLVNNGVIKGDDAEMLIAGAGIGLATLGWSLWQKYGANLKLKIGLALPAGSTVEDLKREAKLRGSGAAGLSLAMLLLLIPASLFTSACDKDAEKAIASNVARVADLIQTGREVRDQLVVQNFIDKDDAYKITVALEKTNNALKVFNLQAQTYKSNGLPPDGAAKLKKLAEDISAAATELISNGTFGVKNPDAAARINAAIGLIREAALTIIDSIDRLKSKSPQQASIPALALLQFLAFAFRKVQGAIDDERERSGKTAEEIFAENNVTIDALSLDLAADRAKYAPTEELSAEDHAKFEEVFAGLQERLSA